MRAKHRFPAAKTIGKITSELRSMFRFLEEKGGKERKVVLSVYAVTGTYRRLQNKPHRCDHILGFRKISRLCDTQFYRGVWYRMLPYIYVYSAFFWVQKVSTPVRYCLILSISLGVL